MVLFLKINGLYWIIHIDTGYMQFVNIRQLIFLITAKYFNYTKRKVEQLDLPYAHDIPALD